MFCKYCGKKIEIINGKCPHCEKEQESLQMTSGYFGILSVVNGQKSIVSEASSVEQKDQIKYEETKKENMDLKRKIQKYENAMKQGKYKMLSVCLLFTGGLMASFLYSFQNQTKLNDILVQQKVMEEMVTDNQAKNNSAIRDNERLLVNKENSLREEIDKHVSGIQESISDEKMSNKKQMDELESSLRQELKEIEELIYLQHEELHGEEEQPAGEDQPISDKEGTAVTENDLESENKDENKEGKADE